MIQLIRLRHFENIKTGKTATNTGIEPWPSPEEDWNFVKGEWLALPLIVLEPGQYRTRAGQIVTINTVSDRPFGCKGNYPNGIVERWHPTGRIFTSDLKTTNDIMEKV